MLFKQMNYFVTVVEKNSFTEAAAESFVSQSAISQQIQALEEELGVELLQRQHRKFTLTPAGEHFYREAKQMLAQIDELVTETKRIAEDEETQLNLGYLRVYSGQELHQAIAEFSMTYPEVSINIVNGTHEELYQELRQNTVDVVLSDQRRAFSDEYVNFELVQPEVQIELSARNPLSQQDAIDIQASKGIPCILIANSEQQASEEDFYRNTLGFDGTFLFAESLEEGRMMVIGNRGFLPIEVAGTLPAPAVSVKRLPLTKNGKALIRNYCAFWRKERTNYYIEEFANVLKKLFDEEE
ncbi:LysR family transcriptional regulator [Enterococcus sp. 669A]|uniref:LysR family transcriptional regulator n=1 Tax=Candidatus Enterococcus moelleringii TaxID=2815325 RepID=A0ABS3L8Y9_9ENTE|nr:LysR family transcriptional regulator [Enterococcus sp. 669A]MBO1306065.1 LysR family transcriptional regulator [Enterococcus sp. 669A]